MLQRIDCARFDQRRAALGHHHRIKHQRHCGGALGQDGGDRLDHGGIVQHAGLDRVGTDILEHDLHLPADEVGRDRQDAEYTLGVLGCQRGDSRRRKGVEHRHGLDVCLDAGAAAGIRAGDDQNPPLHDWGLRVILPPEPAT